MSINTKNMKEKLKVELKFNKSSIKWIILVMILLVAFAIFIYQDIENTVDNTNIFIKSVFQGRFLEFYEMSVEQAKTNYAANYGIFIYIILGIWFLPIYILTMIFGENFIIWPVQLLWAKTFIVIMAILCTCLVYKIILLCTDNKDKANIGMFLFLSSVLVFFPVFIIAQLDIISVFFMLLGIYGYLKNNKVLFFVSFLIAVPLKMFAIILALPLILLREKNLFKAGIKWGAMAGLIILEKIIFSGSVIYKYALAAQSRDAISQVLNSSILIGRNITVFLALYICILVYSYILKNRENDNKTILWICFYVWAVFTSLVMINDYWVILVSPFLIINILINDKHMYINTFLDTIGGLAYFLCGAVQLEGVLANTRLLLPNLRSESIAKYESVHIMFEKMGLIQYSNLFSTIFVLILILTFPYKKKEENEDKPKEITEGLLILRSGLLLTILLIIIYAFTATTNPISYSNLKQDSVIEEVDLLDVEKSDVVTQPIKFNNEIELDELVLKFINNHVFRNNFALLNVEIWNITKNECIFSTSIGCNSIIDKEKNTYINLKKTKVNQYDDYEIKLSATKGIKGYQLLDKFRPYFIKEIDEKIGPAKVNGEAINHTLYFQIR